MYVGGSVVESVEYVPERKPLDVLPVDVAEVLLLIGMLVLKLGVGLIVG